MIDSAYHRRIAKQARSIEESAIENEKKNKTYNSIEADQVPNNTLLNRLSGYEKEYVKQVPVIAGGRANMEMEVKPKLARRKNIAEDVGMLYQDQLSNFKGAGVEYNTADNEIDRDIMTREMGAGMMVNQEDENKDAQMNQLRTKLGGSKKKTKVPEVVEGSVLVIEKQVEKPKRGRKPKAMAVVEEPKAPPQAEPTGNKMQRRASKIKEIMKSRGLSMIAASKYIKDNKITY